MTVVTKRQIKANRDKARRWRQTYPERSIASSKRWKEKHPGWWRGPKLIQWLTTALVNGNADSTVFKEAGMTWDEWTLQCDITKSFLSDSFLSLANGSKLSPIKHWREFDLNDPEQVKQFLAPGNFRLISK